MSQPTLVRLVDAPIDVASLYDEVRHTSCGAVAVFAGTSREVHAGRSVARLDYEAYRPMAQKELEKLAADMRERFPGTHGIALVHRLGEVPLAEASVVVAVSTPHRDLAFDACRYGIDTLKVRVPIWKKELYQDGAEPRWISNKPQPGEAEAAQ